MGKLVKEDDMDIDDRSLAVDEGRLPERVADRPVNDLRDCNDDTGGQDEDIEAIIREAVTIAMRAKKKRDELKRLAEFLAESVDFTNEELWERVKAAQLPRLADLGREEIRYVVGLLRQRLKL